MKEKKKVLIITYYWPPASGPGVQRFLKISKYISNFGWQPIILTVKNGSSGSSDSSLDEDIDKNLKVFKTKSFEPFEFYNRLTGKRGKQLGTGLIGLESKKGIMKRILLYIRANYFIPDARKGWIKFAYKKALEIIEQENISAIITTGPPHSTHLVGLKIKRKFDIGWIADFRDPWTNIFYNKFFPRTNLTIRKDRLLEDNVLQSADIITVVSKGLFEEFSNRPNKCEVIYNGYDEEDLPAIQDLTSKKFILSYIGNFKPNQNAPVLWEAISELLNEVPELNEKFVVNLTGNLNFGLSKIIEKYQLTHIVEINKFVPHAKAVELMVKSNLLLFIVPEIESNHLIITGKLFEYIASQTPILSIGPEDGNASEIITISKRDKILDYQNKNGIKNVILNYYNRWIEESGKLYKYPKSNTEIFSRKHQAKQFADNLNKLKRNEKAN